MPVIAVTIPSGEQRSSPKHRLTRRILGWLLPAANPDFESRFPLVTSWWIEVSESGVPQREVGFAATGEPIVIGPFGANMGYWTDSSMQFEPREYERVDDQAFSQAWSSFERQWNARNAQPAA